MTAPVRIEARAWNDIRFRTLARLLGMSDPDLALIKVARLWSWETENYHPDRPTYVLDRDTIESVLGPDGPEALVRAQLAEATTEGWRMKGTEGQIEWRYGLAEKRQRAGRARADNAPRDERGRLTSKKYGDFDNSSPPLAGCAGPAPVQHPPAQSSALTPSPSQEEEIARNGRAHQVRPKQRAAQLPDTWTPSDSEANQSAEADARRRGVDPVRELAQLRDWALSKGMTRKDWNAQWRNWLRNARPTLAIGSWNGTQRVPKTILIRSTSDEPDLGYDPNKS